MAGSSLVEIPDTFFQKDLITDVLHVVKSGKEATVYCCRAHPDTGRELLAAKVYRDRVHRNFANDARYQEGRVIRDRRLRRAAEQHTRKGQVARFDAWVRHEFATLTRLYAAGAAVPEPVAHAEHALLLEYLGDAHDPAPMLLRARLAPGDGRRLFDDVIRNVRLWLACDCVHADLSPYNILYWQDEVTIIDFPQAVDPRFNPHAYDLLERDLVNVCGFFARAGVVADGRRLAGELWAEYVCRGM